MILRHRPDLVGLELDPAGWVPVDRLLRALKQSGRGMSRDMLLELVAADDKQRFTVAENGERIRAAQGHSVDVNLDLKPKIPPATLYHGTARRMLDEIFSEGLLPMKRRQVHLSADPATAKGVGGRHGEPIVLTVGALDMHSAGHEFFQADNGVWLTDVVPPQFLGFATLSEDDT
ncbi:RNA 2'-phosphotransferase [Brevirhabdus pacifica]|uniref:RNA 2'-phosphotransferase n=1 Tax=Brevirhabdus pacifica TaxID=1267768 RepID=UPI001F22CD53|nr:RNA 2'-phosphotransferase [Brevirhabdus pacifica]